MIISGIYRIRARAHPERIYIGSAVNIYERWYTHRAKLRKNKHENSKLQNNFNKYGESDFMFDILLLCSSEDLIEAEQFLINSMNPWFNICKTANSQLGHTWAGRGKQRLPRTQEHKDNLSRSLKGRVSPMKGKTVDKEIRNKISTATKEALKEPAIIKKMREAKKDKYNGENHPFFGKHHTKESKEKNRIAHLGKPSKKKGKKYPKNNNTTDEHNN